MYGVYKSALGGAPWYILLISLMSVNTFELWHFNGQLIKYSDSDVLDCLN